jgi:outer membrane protein assembly factor BamD (BamD/ComL family)
MSYFIFLKNLDNIEGTLYRIAENQNDLNNLNIIQADYKIIEESQSNFNLVKFKNKFPTKYNNNVITYIDLITKLENKEHLKTDIDLFKQQIKQFIDSNPNHPLFSRWSSYLTQLNNLNLDSITYPLNNSLEQYFNDLGQPSLNPLQIP